MKPAFIGHSIVILCHFPLITSGSKSTIFPLDGYFVPAGERPVKLISFYHQRQEWKSSPIHVPALGVGLLLSAAGHVNVALLY